MAYDGTEGGEITLSNGSSMTGSFRTNYPNEVKGRFFGKDILKELLAQEDCMGIRMYFAIDSNDDLALVIVGADSNGDDIIGKVADISLPCPSYCGESNDLNS
ncbi:MAG: hypothetical protein HUJ25_09960 [Crocinitomicaceae bacterium]|nr:hypothetical protein [Crocinitomicaceae bacterium]